MGVATLASRVLGLVRDVVQGIYFGTTAAADAFVVATRVPTLLRDLFAEGAMSAAFVPTFTRCLTQDGKPAAWRLGSQVINGLLLITGLLVLIGIVFAGPIVGLFAEDYGDVPGKLELTVSLTRVNMPFLLLVAVAAAFMGMLNALRRFFIPASSPTMYNVAFIICAVVFVPVFTRIGIEPVMALSVGMLVGGVVQILVQWPALRREGYRHQWILDLRDQRLREVLYLMGPGSLGVAAAQINLLVNTQLATGEDGAASALGYAFRLMYMPIGIFSVSIATAAIPELARHAAKAEIGEMRSTLSWGLRLMLMLSIPATVGLMVLSTPIVAMIYQGGNFTAESTLSVAGALMFYAPGIVGYSVVKIVSPTFYSLHDARTPVIVSVVTIAANLVLNIWLNSVMGFRGLALGTAIAANINAGLLLYLLSRRISGVDARRVGVTLLKVAIASAVMGLATYYADVELARLLPSPSQMSRILRVSGGIGAGLGTLALAAWALRIEEFQQATGRILKRLRP
jgi:putative peptidoglycan lipid II flippase